MASFIGKTLPVCIAVICSVAACITVHAQVGPTAPFAEPHFRGTDVAPAPAQVGVRDSTAPTPEQRAELPPRSIQVEHGDPALLAELFGGYAIWGGEAGATGNARGGNVRGAGARGGGANVRGGWNGRGGGQGGYGGNRGGVRGFGSGNVRGGSNVPFAGFVPVR